MPSVNTNNDVENESGIEQHIGVGSCFTPTKIALQTWISTTAAHLKTHFQSRQITRQIESLIEYHNAYTIYTLGMLLSGTGYRAVCNPLPSLSLIFPERNTLCISDKDSTKTFSHMRVIVCARLLRQQLQFYQVHINTYFPNFLLQITFICKVKASDSIILSLSEIPQLNLASFSCLVHMAMKQKANELKRKMRNNPLYRLLSPPKNYARKYIYR